MWHHASYALRNSARVPPRLALFAKDAITWGVVAVVAAALLINKRSRILADGSKDCFAVSRNRAIDRDVHSLTAEMHRLLAYAGLCYS